MSTPIFQATLCNSDRVALDVITIPFPLSGSKYDHFIGLLTERQMGDTVRQDCYVDTITSDWPALQALEGQYVNVDELDYLAKRLDSFEPGEKAEFQGMASVNSISDIKDFINLTFCCQQATVICDFRDLEAVGRSHLLTLSKCGHIALKDYQRASGNAIAQALIMGGKGQITPYGVVYDNGMELEPIYDGRHFPECYDAPHEVHISISLQNDSDRKAALLLPCSAQKVIRTLQRLGATDLSQCALSVQSDRICDAILSVFVTENDVRGCLDELNALAKRYQCFADTEITKFHAVFDIVQPETPAATVRLAENIELFDVLADISTPEELGEYILQRSGAFEYDKRLEDFYDYKKLGHQHIEAHSGQFTSWGYVCYNGEMPLEELMVEGPAEVELQAAEAQSPHRFGDCSLEQQMF